MRVASGWLIPAETPRQFLSACLDEPWMAHLLRRHGLTSGRITVVTLRLFYQAKLPLAVVRDFLGTQGDVAEPRAVLERAAEFVVHHGR